MTENVSVYPRILACSARLFLSFTDLKSRLFLYFCLKTGSPLGTVGFQVWIEARFKVSALLWYIFFPLSISALWYSIFSRLHSSHSDLHCSLLSPFFVLSSLISWGLGVSSRRSVWCCAASFLTPRRSSLPTEALSTHTRGYFNKHISFGFLFK